MDARIRQILCVFGKSHGVVKIEFGRKALKLERFGESLRNVMSKEGTTNNLA